MKKWCLTIFFSGGFEQCEGLRSEYEYLFRICEARMFDSSPYILYVGMEMTFIRITRYRWRITPTFSLSETATMEHLNSFRLLKRS